MCTWSALEECTLDIHKCPILRSYSLYQTEFVSEDYLTKTKDVKLRRGLSK